MEPSVVSDDTSALYHDHIVRRKPVPTEHGISYTTLSQDFEMEDLQQDHRTSLGLLQPNGSNKNINNESSNKPKSFLSIQTHGSILQQAELWLPEILCCLTSIAIFGLIVVVLSWRNNRPLPEWYAGLTVNTVVALLSTVCRASLVVPISEGISQLKWNWLATGRRSLRDLEVYNQASRGPWGSLQMVVTARGQAYAIMAAVVLTTGLVTSMFTQSAIVLETRSIRARNGVASAYALTSTPPTYVNSRGTLSSEFYLDAQRTAIQWIMASSNDTGPDPLEPMCSSSDCSWPPFSSLGVCFSVKNVTDHLDVTTDDDGNIVAKLFDDVSLKVTTPYIGDPLPKLISSPNPKREEGGEDESDPTFWPIYRPSIAFNGEEDKLKTAISQMYAIFYHRKLPKETFAVEMLWHFCAQTYDLSVEEGRPVVDVKSHTEVIQTSLDNQTVWLGEMTLATEDGKKNMTIIRTEDRIIHTPDSNLTTIDFHNMFKSAFTGELVPKGSALDYYYSSGDGKDRFFTWISRRLDGGLHKSSLWNEVNEVLWHNTKAMGESVAAGMTNLLRQYGDPVQGEARVPVVFITISWPWIVFLAVQIALSCLFLAIIIVQTARLGVEVVKSSELATLFAVNQGQGRPVAPDGGPFVEAGLRQELDRDIAGQLQKREGVWSVTLDHYGPPSLQEKTTLQRLYRKIVPS